MYFKLYLGKITNLKLINACIVNILKSHEGSFKYFVHHNEKFRYLNSKGIKQKQ